MFKSVVILYTEIPKDFDFLGLSNFSRDMVIPLVRNFQSVLVIIIAVCMLKKLAT